MIKKKLSIFLFLLILLQTGCKEDPSYNPFDELFDISISKVVSNGCDTLFGECGYINLIEKSKTAKMYYQTHFDDCYEVVAKGYVYHIDTFRLANFEDYFTNQELKDSIKQLPFDINILDLNINKYNYSYLDRDEEGARIVNRDIRDTVELRFNIAETDHLKLFVRNLEYFVGKTE